MPNDHLYRLSYALRVNDPPLTAEQARAQVAEFGACDAVILMSILFPADGSYSLAVLSKDGRSKDGAPLSGNELFMAWMLWAHNLKDDPDLSPGRRQLVGMIWETLCEVIMGESKAVPQ